jgi:signal transduction histidine kinase
MSAADREALYELTRFNEGIDQALTESIARFDASLQRSRELFLAVLGHDLRNPLGAMMLSASALVSPGGGGRCPATTRPSRASCAAARASST